MRMMGTLAGGLVGGLPGALIGNKIFKKKSKAPGAGTASSPMAQGGAAQPAPAAAYGAVPAAAGMTP